MRPRWPLGAAVVAIVGFAACSPANRSTDASVPVVSPTIEPDAAAPSSAGSPPGNCVGPLDGPDTRQYRDDVAVEELELVSLDIYRRSVATGCSVIVWVHGGGWSVGDKAGNGIETKVALAGELGAVLVSVNHRLVTADGGIRWPVMGQDVAAAVAWVVEQAGALGIDPTRVALMGHSAGAHLVSIVATNPDLLEQAGASRAAVRRVVALDSAAYDITPTEVRTRPLFAAAFGDDPAQLADASPMAQAAAHPEGIPDTLTVTRGSPVRVAEATEFAATVAAGGARVEVVEAQTYTHEQVNVELGAESENLITPPTRDFLQTCFS